MINAEAAIATPRERTPAADRGRAWWQAVAVAASVAVLYFPVLIRLVQDWWVDPNFSHGFFVPLFSGYLLWNKRETLASIPTRPSWWGALIVLGSMAVLIVGRLGSELFLSRTSLILLLAGLAILFRGWRFFREVLFPWAFLFLMVPIPAIVFNQITFPLQLLASRLASMLLPWFGVPVLREGNVIQLPAMSLEVAEACSGIRSLMSLGTLAIIYGYLLEPIIWRRVLLFAASIPIAVAANSLRIVGTGLTVQYWDAEKALGFFHEFSGFVIFIVSLLLLGAVHGLMRLALPAETRPSQ